LPKLKGLERFHNDGVDPLTIGRSDAGGCDEAAEAEVAYVLKLRQQMTPLHMRGLGTRVASGFNFGNLAMYPALEAGLCCRRADFGNLLRGSTQELCVFAGFLTAGAL
jgi:hypothetical protein